MSVVRMNRCFIAFLAIMMLQLLFHVHTVITMHLIVKQRQNSTNPGGENLLERDADGPIIHTDVAFYEEDRKTQDTPAFGSTPSENNNG